MVDPDLGSQRSEEEISQEKEQTPEEILEVIKEAIEKDEGVLMTQLTADGKVMKGVALLISLEGNCLTIEESGYIFDIEIGSIKRVE